MTKKICISGYYGFDNFGDETILKILIENIKNFSVKSSITVFSYNPDKTSTEHNVNSIYSFDIKSIIKSIQESDCLISGGGSLLQDVTSAKSLIYYLGIIFLAQFFKKKTIILAQGIGPIKNKFLSRITSNILKKATYITVRDKNSLNILKKWNINATLCIDPVWNINIDKKQKNDAIGIQLRKSYNLTEAFIDNLATAINKNYSNKKIKIISLQNSIDLEVCNLLKEKLHKLNKNLNIETITNTSNEHIINEIANLDELIAMRFHACLIALKSGVKLLPINYDIKVEELANSFELPILNLDKTETMDEQIKEFKYSIQKYNNNLLDKLTFDFKSIEKII